jgi:hypothetical protein
MSQSAGQFVQKHAGGTKTQMQDDYQRHASHVEAK